MAQYLVAIIITSTADALVEANSKEEALEKVRNGEWEEVYSEEWQTYDIHGSKDDAVSKLTD